MKKTVILIACIIAGVCLIGCQRMPLLNWTGNVIVECKYHPEEIKYNPVKAPERIDINFYDIGTGKRVSWGMLMATADGASSAEYSSTFNVKPGKYNIVAHSVISGDNQVFYTTKVTYPETYSLVTAEVAQGGEMSGFKVINNPIQIYAESVREYEIPVTSEDEEFLISLDLHPILDSYRLIISGVTGLENFKGMTGYLSNNSKEILLAGMERNDAAVLKFTGDEKSAREGNIIVDFNTFGIREDGEVKLRVDLLSGDGRTHSKTFDITEQVRPGDDKNVIYVDFPTELHALEQGGLEPVSEKWDENVEQYNLQ